MSVRKTPVWNESKSGPVGEITVAKEKCPRILTLVQLARRAGKAALGFEAAKRSVQHGICKILILANDIGEHQHRSITHESVTTLILTDKKTLGNAFAMNELSVATVDDDHFASGILKILNS